MNDETSSFDELRIVSDLHLGGRAGQQIFGKGARLGAVIRGMTALPGSGARAFIINGDFVDFLAEEPAEYLDAPGAVGKLQRIIADATFNPVFEALRELLRSPSCHLVIVLGNHDVELALPHVQHWLGVWLTEGMAERRGRLHFATDGSGYQCLVGNKRVLCIHGNEFDDWNVIDHRALLQFIRAWKRGQALPSWTPNGGTRLVVDVINVAKRKHALVDLLKPETKAAIPLVLAFSPELLGRAGAALQAVLVRGLDGLRMSAGFLGSDSRAEDQQPTQAEALMATLSAVEPSRAGLTEGAGRAVPDEFLQAQRRIELKQPPLLGYDPNAPVETLGLREWWDQRSQPSLRAALQRWLANDTTFDETAKDDTFRAVDEAVGANIDYVFAGHTHLRRALRRRWPGCVYFNTGTWIRLIQIDPSLLASDDKFAKVVEALKGRSITDLDSTPALEGKKLMRDDSTVGRVTLANGSVVAQLATAGDDGTLTSIDKTVFS